MNADDGRIGRANRETAETAIAVEINLDGDGTTDIATGIGFLDHMLESFATHGRFDLTVDADGDLDIDEHHTVEDVGLVLGSAVADALGAKTGIERFADRRVPLDEAVVSVVLDVSGRDVYRFEGSFSQERVGEFTSHLARHFWRSVSSTAGLTLHVAVSGANAHHEIEALFKATGKALDDATRVDGEEIPSTKGDL